jgi:hypothetical protein
LRKKLDAGEIRPPTVIAAVPPIRHFCEMSDIILNFKKIGKLLPQNDSNAKDKAYTRDQIRKALQFADMRMRLTILFLSSSGMRIGALSDEKSGAYLKDGDVRPVFEIKGEITEMTTDEAENKDAFSKDRLLAAHVIVYRDTSGEYDAFVTPEAYNTYLEYRNLRKKFGETITGKSPALIRRFEINPDNTRATIDSHQVSRTTIAGMLNVIMLKAGLRVASVEYSSTVRYETKISAGFRKYFKSTIAGIRTEGGKSAIEPLTQEWLYGHALSAMFRTGEHYDRRDSVRLLLDAYLKAVKELTISDEERLQVKVTQLESQNEDIEKRIDEAVEKKIQQLFGKADVAGIIARESGLKNVNPEEQAKLKPNVIS